MKVKKRRINKKNEKNCFSKQNVRHKKAVRDETRQHQTGEQAIRETKQMQNKIYI